MGIYTKQYREISHILNETNLRDWCWKADVFKVELDRGFLVVRDSSCLVMLHSKLPLQGSLQTPLQTSVILLVVDVQEGLGLVGNWLR